MSQDIETLELENRMLRERNERLQAIHASLFANWPGGMEEIEVALAGLQSDLAAAQEERRIAVNAYRELLVKYDKCEERTQR